MGFLDQLKSQAAELTNQNSDNARDLSVNFVKTEAACEIVSHYLRELAKQLNVIEPTGPRFILNGNTPWPAMKLVKFSADARKKSFRDKEAFDTISIGWTMIPKMGIPVGGAVIVSFLPDADNVQRMLDLAGVSYERKEHRHPERRSLLSVRFEYTTQARGGVMVTADHDAAQLVFRVANAEGFGVFTIPIESERVNSNLMDELAKLIVAQPSRFP
ncbi:hypothetical protein [Rhodoferax sp. GW822-FHT02A01]|uniref:hypothetical protein n=1 Tax=Rhodoferax sp. GW822-FHT02A01 TaxID=3141537 RepID=UPI00315DD061